MGPSTRPSQYRLKVDESTTAQFISLPVAPTRAPAEQQWPASTLTTIFRTTTQATMCDIPRHTRQSRGDQAQLGQMFGTLFGSDPNGMLCRGPADSFPKSGSFCKKAQARW